MKSRIIFSVVLLALAIVTLAFGDESEAHGVLSNSHEIWQLTKDALPQITFIVVLIVNLCTALVDPSRNFQASLIATTILVGITYWGGFFRPLIDFFAIRL